MTISDFSENNQLMIGTWLTIPAPSVLEGLGRAGLDLIIVDLEHGELGLEAHLADLIRAADVAEMAVYVRLPAWQLELTGRILDSGARGIVIPQVEEVTTLDRAFQYTHYPPSGRRGLSVQTRAGHFGHLDPNAPAQGEDGAPVIVAQIESRVGFDHLAEIVSSPHLDAVLLGPNDLALSLESCDVGDGLDLPTAALTLAHETQKHGLVFGSVCADIDGARSYLNLGARMLVLSGALLWRAYSELAGAIRQEL